MDLPPAEPERGAHTDAFALLGVGYEAADPEKEGRLRLRTLARNSHPDRALAQAAAAAAAAAADAAAVRRDAEHSSEGECVSVADAAAGGAEAPSFAELSAAAAMLASSKYVGVLRGAATTAAAELDSVARRRPRQQERAGSTAVGNQPGRVAGSLPAAAAQQQLQRMKERVREVLYEVEYRRLAVIRAAAVAAATAETPDDGGLHGHSSGPSAKRRSESKRRRREKRKRSDDTQGADNSNGNGGNGSGMNGSLSGAGGAGGMFGRPTDPTVPTQHLFIAPAGPRFGASAEDISLALSAVVPGEVTGVTVPGPSAANVYASFRSAAAASAVREVFDRKTAGAAAQKLFNRSVAAQYSELILPLVAAAAGGGGRAAKDMSPAELLQHVRATMTTLAADEEAGNLPMGPVKTVMLVRCPLCSAREAEFQRGRPLRMHLMSPLHGLTGQPLADTVALADVLAQRAAAAAAAEHAPAACDGSNVGIADIEREDAIRTGSSSGAGPRHGHSTGHSHGAANPKEATGASVAATASAVAAASAREPAAAAGVDAWFDAAQRGDLQALRQMARGGAAAYAGAGGGSSSGERKVQPSCTDQHGSTALHWAAGSGRLAACKLLVHELSVPANEECSVGRADRRNALHWAARNGQIAVCAWLVDEEGLSVNAPTADGTTPFHWAAWQGQFACCRWLRDAGAEVAAVNSYGCNAVHWAALTGNLPMCAWLAEMGLPLDMKNNQGHSPLHKAAFKGEAAMCTWLLRHGGRDLDPQAVDRGGYTPAMIARERGFPALSQMLEAAGTERADKDSAAVIRSNTVRGVSFRFDGPVGKLVLVDGSREEPPEET